MIQIIRGIGAYHSQDVEEAVTELQAIGYEVTAI